MDNPRGRWKNARVRSKSDVGISTLEIPIGDLTGFDKALVLRSGAHSLKPCWGQTSKYQLTRSIVGVVCSAGSKLAKPLKRIWIPQSSLRGTAAPALRMHTLDLRPPTAVGATLFGMQIPQFLGRKSGTAGEFH